MSLMSLLVLPGFAGCTRPEDHKLATVQSFRSARDGGDLETARSFLSDDPRVWYEQRDGPGRPWKLGGGRWSEWDTHFNSSSTEGPLIVEGDAVSVVLTEINDYYRLTEKGPTPVRLTWFIDGDGLIEGYMVSAVPTDAPSTSRFDEFEAWAKINDPEELAYLLPDGSIDPTSDRAPRFRRLLERWRAEAGLPPIE